MAVKCRVIDCKFNEGGYCSLFFITIDENRRCEEYMDKRDRRE